MPHFGRVTGLICRCTCALALAAAPSLAQSSAQSPTPDNPFPAPIEGTRPVIAVNIAEFARIPNVGPAGSHEAPRMMLLVDEPGTRRLFVNAMQGFIYSVSYDGKAVTPYLDLNAAPWTVAVEARGRERGFQSFAFHPQFGQRGAPGYGKFYTYTDTSRMTAKADFPPSGEGHTHDTVLLEWTARDAAAARYDGGEPRELFRFAQPFPNHNAGHIAFNPLARPGTPEFGLLYVGVADGGSGGDPYNHAQNLASGFGKIFRIDPLGKGSANGQYGIPADNPFAGDNRADTLGEIYAYGVRNPQRFAWDAKTGAMFVADIGQNIVEEVSPVTRGANLGWNKWEASFRYANRSIDLANPRSEPGMTWPVAEWDHRDPLLGRSAVTGVHVYRGTAIGSLTGTLLFGDMPSGELFYIDADNLPAGGQAAIGRVLFNHGGTRKTLLQLIREKNAAQGVEPAPRADIKLGIGPEEQIFLFNKGDGTIRVLTP